MIASDRIDVAITENPVRDANMAFVENVTDEVQNLQWTIGGRGGFLTASYEAKVSQARAFRYMSEHVGRRIVMTHPTAPDSENICWEGMIYTVAVDDGKQPISRSLADHYNKIQVQFAELRGSGYAFSFAPGTTYWLVISRDGATSDVNFYRWPNLTGASGATIVSSDSANGASYGVTKTYNGAWTPPGCVSLFFGYFQNQADFAEMRSTRFATTETSTIDMGKTTGPIQYIAQAFTFAGGGGAYAPTRLTLKLVRIGTPVDNIKIEIYGDSAGSPDIAGGAKATYTYAGASLPTAHTWVSFDFGGLPTTGRQRITAAQSDTAAQALYGIRELVYSGGAMYSADATVLRDRLYESKRRLSAMSTVQRGGGGGEMRLRVECVGFWETLDRRIYTDAVNTQSKSTDKMIAQILTSVGQFVNSDQTNIAQNSHSVSQYMPNTRTAQTILRNLSGYGDAVSQSPWALGIYEQRKAYYAQRPTTIGYRTMRTDTGEVIIDAATGQVVPPWLVRPNKLIEVPDLIPDAVNYTSDLDNTRVMGVDEVVFTAPNRVELRPPNGDPSIDITLARFAARDEQASVAFDAAQKKFPVEQQSGLAIGSNGILSMVAYQEGQT